MLYTLLKESPAPQTLLDAFLELDCEGSVDRRDKQAVSAHDKRLWNVVQQTIYLQNSYVPEFKETKKNITGALCDYLLKRDNEIMPAEIVSHVGEILKRGMDNRDNVLSAKELNSNLGQLCQYTIAHNRMDYTIEKNFASKAVSIVDRLDPMRDNNKIPEPIMQKLSDPIKTALAMQGADNRAKYSRYNVDVAPVLETTLQLFESPDKIVFIPGCNIKLVQLLMQTLDKNILETTSQQQRDLLKFAQNHALDITVPGKIATLDDEEQVGLNRAIARLCNKGPDKEWRNTYNLSIT